MYQNLPSFIVLTKFSLASLIEDKLREILSLSPPELLEKLRLLRCNNYSSIVYRCAIAFPLSRKMGLNSQEMGVKLSELLKDLPREKGANLGVKIGVLPSGMLEFIIENIDIWLDFLANNLVSNYQKKIEVNNIQNEDIFFIKYTLKRCYSLLNLGEDQGIIKLEKKDKLWLQPEVINYDNLYQKEEQKLIGEFVTVFDQLAGNKNKLSLAINLSHQFWQFERYCRIFGEVQKDNLYLSQARLRLVFLTCLILDKLLVL